MKTLLIKIQQQWMWVVSCSWQRSISVHSATAILFTCRVLSFRLPMYVCKSICI